MIRPGMYQTVARTGHIQQNNEMGSLGRISVQFFVQVKGAFRLSSFISQMVVDRAGIMLPFWMSAVWFPVFHLHISSVRTFWIEWDTQALVKIPLDFH